MRCDPLAGAVRSSLLEVPSGLAPNMLFDRLSGEGKSLPDALDSWGTPEFKLFSIREHRNALLRLCDPLFLRHQSQLLLGASTTLTNEEFLTLLSYMQALRDFPANVDLNNITWPAKPAFMQPAAAQTGA